MVKGNNVLPNVHFGKWWQRYVKTWFNQPGRAKSRQIARRSKAAAIAPRPTAGLLRPAVHPPTQRYNLKIRAGRGFTLDELKEAGISKKQARTIGIAVDHRRKNKSVESLQSNAARLKLYKSKLVVFPRKSKAKKGDTARSELANVAQNTHKDIIALPKPSLRIKSRAITKAEKDASAYATLRRAFKEAKEVGKKKAEENAAKLKLDALSKEEVVQAKQLFNEAAAAKKKAEPTDAAPANPSASPRSAQAPVSARGHGGELDFEEVVAVLKQLLEHKMQEGNIRRLARMQFDQQDKQKRGKLNEAQFLVIYNWIKQEAEPLRLQHSKKP